MKNSLGLDIDEVILLQASLETFLESKNAVVFGTQIRGLYVQNLLNLHLQN